MEASRVCKELTGSLDLPFCFRASATGAPTWRGAEMLLPRPPIPGSWCAVSAQKEGLLLWAGRGGDVQHYVMSSCLAYLQVQSSTSQHHQLTTCAVCSGTLYYYVPCSTSSTIDETHITL